MLVNNNEGEEKETNENKEEENSLQAAQFKQTTTNSSQSLNNIQLFKSVIYQCNNCLFQTDKKTAMNRHSRVHLAQKRKQMEELQQPAAVQNKSSTPSITTPPDTSANILQAQKTIAIPDLLNNNDKSKSYCKDCDIQFSSIKTYQHHRNNYCQKYKTIESVVPIEMATAAESAQKVILPKPQPDELSNKLMETTTPAKLSKLLVVSNQMPTKSSFTNDDEESNSIDLVKTNGSNLLQTNVITPHIPPNAVRMGDLVYLPIFKLNRPAPPENINNTTTSGSQFYQQNLNKEIIDENNNCNNNNNNFTKPLDLSKNSHEKFSKEKEVNFSNDEYATEQSNMPLDLSIKSNRPVKVEMELDNYR